MNMTGRTRIICVLVVVQVCAGFARSAQPAKGVVNASGFAGADLGARINAAVAYCVGLGQVCTIEVDAAGGTISTPPDLPIGFTLRFNPRGSYTLATHWVMSHRGVSYYFNGAHFTYTLADGNPAFYVGKQISGTVSITGTQVTWISGTKFNDVDVGDQLEIDSGNGASPLGANIGYVNSPASMTLLSSPGNFTSVRFAVYEQSSDALGPYAGRAVSINDLVVDEGPPFAAADTSLELELVDGVVVNNFTSNNFVHGNCLSSLGSITANYYSVHCNVSGNGVRLDQSVIGGFGISASNANRFFGLDIENGQVSSGTALKLVGASVNAIYNLHLEGNGGHIGVELDQAAETGYPANLTQSTGNSIEVGDIERNGDNTSGATDISLLHGSSRNLIWGGGFASVYTGSGSGSGTQIGVSVASTATGNVIRDTTILGSYDTAYAFGGSSGFVYDVIATAAVVSPAFVVDGSGNVTAPAVTSGAYKLANGATFTSGADVPSGTCVNGSLYTNTSGTAGGGNHLYVCGQTGWLAVK